jgi:hypothetical protein
MSDSNAHAGAADGNPLAIPGRCSPVASAQAQTTGAANDGQLLRQLFLGLRGRIRDARGGSPAAGKTHQLSIAVDAADYQAFQALCREHDLTVAMALQLLMSGRELPAARPELLQLPAVTDADALRVLHSLDQRIASCQAEGTMESGEADRLHELLAGISSTIGGTPCPCAERARAERDRAMRPGTVRREDA